MTTLIDAATLGVPRAINQIPIIDLEDACHPDLDRRQQVAYAIRDACINVGFFYVKNHRVSEQLILNAIDQGKQFFELPLEEKMKETNFKGYSALLGENVDPENRGDLHEGFDMGWEDEQSSNREGSMEGVNVWPAGLSGFKEPVIAYYRAVVKLGLQLFPLFALALDLPEDFFTDKTTRPAAIMRLLHYPPQEGVVDDRIMGIGAHTDYECFTILWQDDVPALQVLNTNDQWIDAIPISGTFVINIGDQLARWTNDIFKSTKHRAINRTGTRRYSSPLFFGIDYDVILEVLPSCVSKERPARYQPVIAGEYVKSRLEESYAQSKTQ